MYKPGENITNRFKIMGDLGEGTFAKVLECWDRLTGSYVALKVVRNVPKYRSAAMLELEALNTVRRYDSTGRARVVRLLEWFDWRGHICMVFERLGPSLYDFLRRNSYRPFALDFVRSFARQLLESVGALHRLTLCHTDLKPENILLRSGNYSKEPPPRAPSGASGCPPRRTSASSTSAAPPSRRTTTRPWCPRATTAPRR